MSVAALRCWTGAEAQAPEALARACAGAGVQVLGDGAPDRAPDGWRADLEAARPSVREAGRWLAGELAAERVPVLFARYCTVCMSTLGAAAAAGLRVLWLDAHGDFNTPESTASGFLGGMCLSAACGVWDAPGLPGGLDPRAVVLAGARDLDPPERELLEAAPLVRCAPAEAAATLAGERVFVHLDLDVLDPSVMPAQYPAPGGLSSRELRDVLAAVTASAHVAGAEVTAYNRPDDPARAQRLDAELADAIAPLLASPGPTP